MEDSRENPPSWEEINSWISKRISRALFNMQAGLVGLAREELLAAYYLAGLARKKGGNSANSSL